MEERRMTIALDNGRIHLEVEPENGRIGAAITSLARTSASAQ
jgi:hypothetical protein